MTQKKKTDFKIVTPPDDLSEVRAKTKKIHREKLKKISCAGYSYCSCGKRNISDAHE